MANRRSHSGILIYVNNTLIKFYGMKHNTVESISFALDIMALRIYTEMVESLRYKLVTFGVDLEGPT